MATDSEQLATLAGERHISLTTFRSDGSAVATPGWVVTDLEAGPLVQDLLRTKYGLVKRSLDAFNALVRMSAHKPKPRAEYIEILPRTAA